jgi:hypothetical protein
MVEGGDTASFLKLVHFNQDFPENQTIRKTVKKDASAEVHVGDGKWEKRPTQEVIETFRGRTSKQICSSSGVKCSTDEKQTNKYLNEILYEQSKNDNENTYSLLNPFIEDERRLAEKEVLTKLKEIKLQMNKEYPSLIDKPMFVNEYVRVSKQFIKEYERKWGNLKLEG